MNIHRLVATSGLVLLLPLTAMAQAPSGPFDTLSVVAGPDLSKQPQDLGVNALMGLRLGVNWGAALMPSQGVGVQAGLGVNFSDAALPVLDQIGGPDSRRQVFFTLGVFQRMDRGVEWAVAYDNLYQRYFDTASLAQVRTRVGYDLRPTDQIGVSWRVGLRGDDAMAIDTPVRLDAIGQLDMFHRHTWTSGAQTTIWVGGAGGHDNVVALFTDDTRDETVLVYGGSFHVPLSDRFAMVGATNLMTPTATGTVDAFLGVSWFFGRSAGRPAASRFSPMLPVANNPDFAVNLRR